MSDVVYEIYAVPKAYEEWEKLNHSVRIQFTRKLQKLIYNPCIDKNRLGGDLHGFFKIKLRRLGFRLVYQVINDKIIILIWAIGKREDDAIYNLATVRTQEDDGEMMPISI